MSTYSLAEVFGISDQVQTASYVDRGGLDARLRYLLSTDRHIVIHGDSKQGKSWLRRRLLADQGAIQLQCVSTSTPVALLEQALGCVGVRAELKQTSTRSLEGQLQFEMNTEAQAIFARLRARGAVASKANKERAVEEAGFGYHAANLEWVARVLSSTDRRVVIEDFHYLPEEHRRVMAEWMKALGEYGLHLIVVGVWSETNFLSLYNGDLDGRVEDIELRWGDDELEAVLIEGCRALNIEMVPQLRSRMVSAAYGNVGLLQRLAERLCLEEQVDRTVRRVKVLPLSRTYERATRYVADGMRGRYIGFARNFVQGGSTRGGDVYRDILRALLGFDDETLLEGVPRRELGAQIEANSPGVVRPGDVTGALKRLDGVQDRIKVRPIVLTYSSDARRLYLADRGLLFFRRFGDPVWPWDQPDGEQLF